MNEEDELEGLHRAIGMLDNYSLVSTEKCWIYPIADCLSLRDTNTWYR